MELVRGVRLTDFCDQNQLDLKPRLAATNLPPAQRGELAQRDRELSRSLHLTTADRARTLLEAGQFTNAEPHARWVLGIFARGAANQWEYADAQSLLGGSLFGQQRYAKPSPSCARASRA